MSANIEECYRGHTWLDQRQRDCFGHPQRRNGVKRMDNVLQTMLQGLINKTFDEKLDFVEFEDHVLGKIEKAATSRRQVRKLMEARLDNHDSTAAVARIAR